MSELISKYFSWSEVIKSNVALELGVDNLPSKLQTRNIMLTACALDKIREITGPLIVNSWFRSKLLNKYVGGSANSAHLEGWAVDVKSNRHSSYDLCKMAMESGIVFDQIINEYDRWMHISFDPAGRMQVLTKFSGPYRKGILTKSEYFNNF